MIRRIPFFLLLALLTLLFACTPFSTATVPPFPGTAPPKTTTAAAPFIQPIPLLVGYGYQGPFFELYFTDPANPVSKQQTGGIDQAIIASIDAARLSVDVAIYNLSLRELGNALLRARDRGVLVRMVMESDNRDRPVPQALSDAGIPVLGDRREGLMHHKFIIIDRSQVWTGSMNFTPSGAYQDHNNVIHLRSLKLAENFLVEFNEMFQDDLFGPAARADTPNPVIEVDQVRLETYFSPDDKVEARLVELIASAEESIYFLAYAFTSDPLAEAIIQRQAAGVTVAGVMDADQIQPNRGTEFDRLHQAGINVRRDGNKGLMHHKVLIIDRSVVVTGSYNFTRSADERNDENLLIFFSPEIAQLYLDEFWRIYQQAQTP